MEKLKRIIENAMDKKWNITKGLYSLYDIQEIIIIYNNLIADRKTITINEKVAKVCTNCGINVKKRGTVFLIGK